MTSQPTLTEIRHAALRHHLSATDALLPATDSWVVERVHHYAKAAGVDPPDSVFGHGFVYHSGEKMSKSLGNAVNPLDVVDVTGPDPLRYFLLREITFGKDGDFTWDAFIGRTNSDLANDLGNLVKRTTDMVAKFLGGEIVAGVDAGTDRTGLAAVARDVAERAQEAYRRFDLSRALGVTWELVRRANQAIQEARPWEIAKDPARRDELAGTLDLDQKQPRQTTKPRRLNALADQPTARLHKHVHQILARRFSELLDHVLAIWKQPAADGPTPT